MFDFFKRWKKKVNVKIDDELEAKDISEEEKLSKDSEEYKYHFNIENIDFYGSDYEDIDQNTSIGFKESYTDEEIHKIIVEQILRVIDSGKDFNSMQMAAEESTKVIGKEYIPLVSTYIKDKVSKPTYMKGKFDQLGQWPAAVENAVLSILYSFKEEGVDELLKIANNGGDACLKAINLLCKLAAKEIEREKIVESLLYIMQSFNEEDNYKVLGYFSQIKGHGKIERLYELYYKKFISEGNLDAAYDIVLDLINIRGRYTREQLIFIKALALHDSELDTEIILAGENGTVNFANVEEQLRIKAAISFYSLNKTDSEINERLYYLKNNSLDAELRAFLAETLE